MIACAADAAAEAKPTSGERRPSKVASDFEADSLAALARVALVASLPDAYEDDRDWGMTRKIESGFELDGRGLDATISRGKKEVRHGLWRRYRIEPIDPDDKLEIRIENLRRKSEGRIALTVYLQAWMHADARVERWRYGIKMLNFHTVADALVELRVDFDVATHWEPGEVLPEWVVDPRVTSVGIRLVDLEVDRISKLDGRLAHELGDNLRHTFENYLQHREERIAEKLNRAVAKNRDKLRIAPADVLAKGWAKK